MSQLEFLVEVTDLVMDAIRFVYDNLMEYVRRLREDKIWDGDVPRLYSRMYQTYLDAVTA